jgi:hypothetical protein
MRMNKKTQDIELICQRCGNLSANLREYIMHKKDIHYARVADTISSMRQLGMDDPEFDKLLIEFPKEKIHPEYVKEARRLLRQHMKEFTK